MTTRLLTLTLASLTSVGAAQAQTAYGNDFDLPPTVLTGVVATLTGGSSIATDPVFFGTYGNFVRSGGNTVDSGIALTLTNLPAHVAIKVSFVMVFLNSWDSRVTSNAAFSPDNLDIRIDGALTGSYTYNNAYGNSDPDVGGNVKDIGGGTLIAEYTQFDTSYFYTDTVVDMATDLAYTFAHTASTLTINWSASGAGWQGLPDEGYGIDNLVVTLTPVPEPGTWALMAGGLWAIGRRAARRG